MEKCPWCGGKYESDAWHEHSGTLRHRFWMRVTAFFWMG